MSVLSHCDVSSTVQRIVGHSSQKSVLKCDQMYIVMRRIGSFSGILNSVVVCSSEGRVNELLSQHAAVWSPHCGSGSLLCLCSVTAIKAG